MTTVGPDWVDKHAAHLPISTSEPIAINGVGISQNTSTRYVTIPLRFLGRRKDNTPAIIELTIEAHILDHYNGPALIGMDVLVPEGIHFNLTRRIATVQSCANAILPLSVTPRKAVPHTAVLRAATELIIPPKSTIIAHVHAPATPEGIDYLVEPSTTRHPQFAFHAAICDSKTTALPISNVTNRPKRISRGMRLVYAHPVEPDLITTTTDTVDAHFMHHTPSTPSTQSTPNSTSAFAASAQHETTEVRTEGKSPEGVTVFGTPQEREELIKVISSFDIWTDRGDTIDIPQHRWMRIPLVDDWQSKINTKPRKYPASPKDMKVITEIFDRLHQQQRMKWTMHPTPFTFPVFVVWRTVMKDGVPLQKGRAVIDIRGLNYITKKDSYPLPDMNDMLQRLHGKLFISVLDGSGWFHQWRIHPDDTHKTTVLTNRGQETMLVTPMGFKNSVAHVQRQADIELKEHDQYAKTYVDDTVVYSTTFSEHCQHLRNVFSTFARLRASLNPQKSYIGFPSVTLLGKRVDGLGLSTDDEKVKAIRQLTFPPNLKELETYLGLTQWFRHFIPFYAYIIHPLQLRKTKLLKGAPAGQARKSYVAKTLITEPTPEELEAFQHLQQYFSQPQFLAHHQPERPLFIETDASKQRGFGAFIYHAKLPTGWSLDKPPPRTAVEPIMFLSKMLTSPEMKLWPTELEMAAVIWTLKQAYRTIQSNKAPVILYTDHSAVAQLATQTTMHSSATDRSNIKLARAAEYIQRFDLTIYHRPGRQHIVADALSRLPSRATPSKPNDDLIFNLHNRRVPVTYAYTTTLVAMDATLRSKFIDGYKEDRHWGPIYEQVLAEHQKPSENQAKLPYSLDDDSLLYTIGIAGAQRLVIPKTLIPTVIAQAHDQTGHPGLLRTMESLRSVCIHRLRHHVEEYIKHCSSCLTNKVVSHKPFGSLQPVISPPIPFHTITMDFVTALPVTTNNLDAVLTVTDKYSKRIAIIAGATTWGGLEWGRALVERLLIGDWGLPAVIISDRDSIFLGQIWKEIFDAFNTKLLTSTAYHPQTDGQSERSNMTIEIALRHVLPAMDDYKDWPSVLPYIQMTLNAARSFTTGKSPHEVIYGMALPNPLTRLSRRLLRHPDFATRLEALDLANFAATRSKYYYDRNHKDLNLQPGDRVFIRLHNGYKIKSPLSTKLQPRRVGPFKILEKVGRLAYRLELSPTMRIHPVLSVAQLEPAPSTPDPYQREDRPGPMTIGDTDDNYEIERLLKKRHFRNRTQYLVSWKGWGDEWNAWYDEDDLPNARELIDDFNKSHTKPLRSKRK